MHSSLILILFHSAANVLISFRIFWWEKCTRIMFKVVKKISLIKFWGILFEGQREVSFNSSLSLVPISKLLDWFGTAFLFCVFVCVCVPHLLYPFIYLWNIACFHVFVIINNAVMNIGVHISFHVRVLVFLRRTQKWNCYITWQSYC